ncbi:T9SS type A sorting domain-containing protein [Mariniflexile sp.]|uniref:T9SS type A sorting domain-containing protein n=1 Tax=Mariniflexile sp. TaxID=1979402 RepID=UPI00356980D7
MLVSFVAKAQIESASCGTVSTEKSQEYLNSIKPQLKIYEQAFIKQQFSKNSAIIGNANAIPIKAHIIRNSNGTGGLCVEDLNNAITSLNAIYASAFMEFFLCDNINYINEDTLCHFKKGDEKSLVEANNVAGLINIYFTEYIENNSDESICGYTDNEGRNDVIVMKNSCAINESSLAHEIGHFFSLVHTHGPDDTKSTELVDGSNCDTDGDGICDTPADPKLTSKNVNNYCQYIGTTTDAHGHTYSPKVNNIMSYAYKACRTEFTQQQLARMYAYYLTAKSYLSCPDFNANITVDVSETCNESLTVNFDSSCKNITKWEWDMNSDGVIDYTTKNPSHTFTSGIYDITLTVSNKSKSIKKTHSKFIKVGNTEVLFDENFESTSLLNDLNWTIKDVTENGYNWLLNRGETTSINTGPILNKSSNNQYHTYMYAEASGAKIGDVAEFISPCIDVVYDNTELEFSYHMFGKGIGELHVDIKTDSVYISDVIPALIGSQQLAQDDDFLISNIDLSEYVNQTIKVVFRAVRGSSWEGDIAIDNILIKTIGVQISDNGINVYPNPMQGDILYVNGIDPDDNSNYQISNLTGKVITSGILTNEQINLSNLRSGMYLLTLSNSKSVITKKIIR